jgi:hypothetical protein
MTVHLDRVSRQVHMDENLLWGVRFFGVRACVGIPVARLVVGSARVHLGTSDVARRSGENSVACRQRCYAGVRLGETPKLFFYTRRRCYTRQWKHQQTT